MGRRAALQTLTVLATAVALLGLATTALALYSDRFTSLVLCTDPENFACSGHYVYGVPNELWTVAVTLLGVALLILSIALRRRPTSTSPARPQSVT